jgi:hypothetical protein
VKKFLDQLKPQERRWVLGLTAGGFLLLNYVFIWPKFKDWKEADIRKAKAEDKLRMFRAEIAHRKDYEREIARFEAAGGSVPLEDQSDQFFSICQNIANLHSVYIQNNSPVRTSTNSPFFIDREMSLTVAAREENLVGFLYDLGSSNSVMRVKAISLRPDGPHQQLSANITILASYQKKQVAPPAKTPTPAANPAPAKPAPQINMPGRTDKTPVPVPGTAPKKPGQPNNKTP